MSSERSDFVKVLLEAVRQAAREGAAEALASGASAHGSASVAELVDKRTVARALGVSMSTVDRMCAAGAVPFVVVGGARRFHLPSVLNALAAVPESHAGVHCEARGPRPAPIEPPGSGGVRLLSRTPKR